jgi:hypothetical protein
MVTQQFWCTFISVYDTFLALLKSYEVRNVQTENVSRNAVCDALMGKALNPVTYWYLMKNECPVDHLQKRI